MAEAMINVALEILSSLIQKELVSFLGVHGEMSKLSDVLDTIKVVLEDAEEKQFTNKALNHWLRKLRDAAYSLDDVLDECSTHALSLEYQDKVQGSCLYFFNLTHVKFRCKMAKKLKNISQRLDQIAEERSKFDLRERVHEERRNHVMEWRETTSKITQQFYGREAEKEKIVKFLVGDASNSEDLSVYPIIGIGGLGKTTLAQQVFHDERVVNHFELRSWAWVSEDFNLKKLSKAIIEAATGSACEDLGLELLLRRLQEVVGRRRYLIVLDDVWSDNKEIWDKVKYVLACGSKGSSILITTRQEKVASIMGTLTPHQLSLLSTNDCWELFKQQAFGPYNQEHEELVAIGQEIVKKCQGVPLAAKTLGSLLYFTSDENQWLHIKESEIWNLPQKEDSIMPALRLSYLNLPTKLRQCFAYLAVFPKDKTMKKKRVIELWMANGFISTNESCEVEDDGDRVWNELYLRSFFEDVVIDEFHYETSFKMHDLVHDLAQVVMQEECCSSGPLCERTRHLSFYGYGQFHNQLSPHSHKLKSLKTIITPKYFMDKFFRDIFLKCFRLRALDLKCLKEVSSFIDQLKHLRYLNLSYGEFIALPDSICRLWNLQILNLNHCQKLQKLPNQFKCLKSLRHLHLEECWSLFLLAPEMGKLACLKTLITYIVGVQKGFLLEEMENLKLEGTLHIQHLERVTSVMDAKRANLVNKHLNMLKLSWERNEQSQLEENEEKILEVLQPHRQLKTLVIRGYLGNLLPQWMVKLPSLKRLELQNMHGVQYIDDESYGVGADRGFQALEFLKLVSLPSLIKLSREDGDNMFPHLSTLRITRCPHLNLPFLPSVTQLVVREECSTVFLGSIQNLPNLERLCFNGDRELTSFPDGMLGGLKYLKQLHVSFLVKLEVLSTRLANLEALEDLTITYCENLETITEEALQGLCSLKSFVISGCPKFKFSAGFQHLIALQHLHIAHSTEVEDIHHTLQHMTILRSLNLYYLPNLASLPDWLGNLRLLESLTICHCPKLMSLPMSTQNLTNLKYLGIYSCLELRKRCKEETGEDWHKIAHVSHCVIKDY